MLHLRSLASIYQRPHHNPSIWRNYYQMTKTQLDNVLHNSNRSVLLTYNELPRRPPLVYTERQPIVRKFFWSLSCNLRSISDELCVWKAVLEVLGDVGVHLPHVGQIKQPTQKVLNVHVLNISTVVRRRLI
jgi:hypothetical protein